VVTIVCVFRTNKVVTCGTIVAVAGISVGVPVAACDAGVVVVGSSVAVTVVVEISAVPGTVNTVSVLVSQSDVSELSACDRMATTFPVIEVETGGIKRS
jgi:repressor of nif and glnA expression